MPASRAMGAARPRLRSAGPAYAPRGNRKERSRAREKNSGARKARRARRQGAIYSGGGIRPRGDGAHPRRQARRPFDEAGDRHRALEGTARWGEVAGADAGRGQYPDTAAGGARSRPCEIRPAHGRFPETIARLPPRLEERGEVCGVARGARQPGEANGAKPIRFPFAPRAPRIEIAAETRRRRYFCSDRLFRSSGVTRSGRLLDSVAAISTRSSRISRRRRPKKLIYTLATQTSESHATM
jgi:hypothetical protein